MKTTYQLSTDDLKAACDDWMAKPANLKAGIVAWMAGQGMPVAYSDDFTLNADGTVTIVAAEVAKPTHAPLPTAPAPATPVVAPPPPTTERTSGFTPDGKHAPIRGDFGLSTDQLQALCDLNEFAAYKQYAQAIIENSVTHKINPLFVLANLVNQGVRPALNNPWGISVDNYPHGPNGAQLGEPNGNVKNGPRRFSESEWRIAFDRQFAVVAGGKAYQNANTIAEWALIDAPPGAENDVHGTNAAEGSDVGAIYNRLVGALT